MIMPGRIHHLVKLILFLTMAQVCVVVNADEKTLTIIHTNDFHGHIQQEDEYAGAARIAAFIKQTRETRPAVLVLDAGDVISGTPVSTLFEGIPIFKIINRMGYDAIALGNHEFDHGYLQIEKFREVADFPIVSANAFGPDGNLLADGPYFVLNIDDIVVGIIGLTTATTPDIVTPAGNRGISFEAPETTLARLIPAIEPEVDLLIVLSHAGYEKDRQLARSVEGIDIIVGGHSHTMIDPPEKIDNTWVVQANKYGTHVGYIEAVVDTDSKQLTGFDGRLIEAESLPAGLPAIKKLVAKWEANVEEVVDYRIATVSKDISPEELQPLLERILAAAADADFGYYNIGGIRDRIREGKVTARHIWNIEPFGNNLVTMTLPGAVLRKVIRKEDEAHPRLSKIEAGTIYTVATNSFVASHAKKQFGDSVEISDKDVLVRDVLINHIREHGFPE